MSSQNEQDGGGETSRRSHRRHRGRGRGRGRGQARVRGGERGSGRDAGGEVGVDWSPLSEVLTTSAKVPGVLEKACAGIRGPELRIVTVGKGNRNAATQSACKNVIERKGGEAEDVSTVYIVRKKELARLCCDTSHWNEISERVAESFLICGGLMCPITSGTIATDVTSSLTTWINKPNEERCCALDCNGDKGILSQRFVVCPQQACGQALCAACLAQLPSQSATAGELLCPFCRNPLFGALEKMLATNARVCHERRAAEERQGDVSDRLDALFGMMVEQLGEIEYVGPLVDTQIAMACTLPPAEDAESDAYLATLENCFLAQESTSKLQERDLQAWLTAALREPGTKGILTWGRLGARSALTHEMHCSAASNVDVELQSSGRVRYTSMPRSRFLSCLDAIHQYGILSNGEEIEEALPILRIGFCLRVFHPYSPEIANDLPVRKSIITLYGAEWDFRQPSIFSAVTLHDLVKYYYDFAGEHLEDDMALGSTLPTNGPDCDQAKAFIQSVEQEGLGWWASMPEPVSIVKNVLITISCICEEEINGVRMEHVEVAAEPHIVSRAARLLVAENGKCTFEWTSNLFDIALLAIRSVHVSVTFRAFCEDGKQRLSMSAWGGNKTIAKGNPIFKFWHVPRAILTELQCTHPHTGKTLPKERNVIYM